MKISRTMISVAMRCGRSGPLETSTETDGGAAIARPEVDRLGAIQRRLPRRRFALVERPCAGGAHWNLAGQPHG